MKQTYLWICVALLAMLVATGCGARGGGAQGGGDDNYVIKFSHVTPADTPKGLAAEKFKELAEEKSGGRITVEIYPNSQLYGDEDELQALQAGNVQMLSPSTAKFTTIAPQLQVLDLPFIFDTPEEASKTFARDTPIGQAIYGNEDLAEKNVKVLALWDSGFKQILANQAVRTPEDLRGVKIRVQPSNVIRSYFSAWGANPTPLSAAEVFGGLQQDVVDGVEAAFSTAYSLKWHTVQPFAMETNHGYIGYVVSINQDFYDSLPEDLKQAVTESADEAAEYNRELVVRANEEAKEKIRQEGGTELIELSEEQRQAFREVVVPEVWDEYADVVGPDLVEQLKREQNVQ